MKHDPTIIPPNWLQNIQSEFRIKRLPEVNFSAQKTSIPGVTMRAAQQANPLVNIPKSGDTLYFDELPVEFLVDEQLLNWRSIFRWMKGLGYPDTTEEYAMLTQRGAPGIDGVYSDITQVLLDSKEEAMLEVRYRDCMPISLSQIDLDVTKSGPSIVTARAVFIYSDYDIYPV